MSIVQERMLRIERELPGLPQFNLPLRLSAAGAAERPRARAEPWLRSCAGTTRCARDLPGWTSCLLLSSPRPPTSNSSLIVEDLAARAPTGNARAKALLLKKAELEAEQEALKPIRHEAARRCSGRASCGSAPTTTFCF